MKPDLCEEIQASAERQASFFLVLGNPQRVLVLWLLSEKERALTEIVLAIGASSASALHHLRILEFSHLVEVRREQNLVYYHIAENEKTRNCLVFRNRPKELWMDSNPI
jgi:DNA-binding transcriptional ArsR family regulator